MYTRIVPVRLPMELTTTYFLDYSIEKDVWKNYCSGSRSYCEKERNGLREKVRTKQTIERRKLNEQKNS